MVRLGGGESRTGGAPRPDSMADSEEPLRPGSYSRELELREIRERYDGWARTKATRGRRRAAALEELVRGRRRAFNRYQTGDGQTERRRTVVFFLFIEFFCRFLIKKI